jgi:hypothetical protein
MDPWLRGDTALILADPPLPAWAERSGRAPATYGVQAPSAPECEITRHADSSFRATTADLPTAPLWEDVYSFGSWSRRVTDGCIGLGLGLGLILVTVAVPGLFFLTIVCSIGLLFLGMQRLMRPYELWIARSGELRFVSVLVKTDLKATSIRCIVRTERRSNGALHEVEIEHWAGSITLDGREDIFRRVRALRPGVPVTTREFDDTD